MATRTCCLPLGSRWLVIPIHHVGCHCMATAPVFPPVETVCPTRCLWEMGRAPSVEVRTMQSWLLSGLNTCFKVTRLWEIKQCWIIPAQCNNLLWNQEREWTTKLERLEPVPVVILENSFLPQAAKNSPALPLSPTNSHHFYKQIPKANKYFGGPEMLIHFMFQP